MSSPYSSTTLLNGLQVLTCSDEHCPVVYLNLVVRAGYRYEEVQERGNAHFLEHMLLKGTSKYPTPDKLSEQVTRLGGYQNASTSGERVNYVIEVAREHAEPMIALLSEMFFDSLLDPDSVHNERRVILEEYAKNRAEPSQFFIRYFPREFYRGHPLGNSSLDADDATKKVTPDMLRAYMQRWYVPERSALVIGGGIPHAQAATLAEKYFGSWKRGGTAAESAVAMTPSHPSHEHIARELDHTKILLGYHVPGANDRRSVAALTLISNFMGYGQSSVLARELRHKRGLVYMTNVSAGIMRDAGGFTMETFTKQNPAQVVELAREILESATDHFKADDLAWVQRQYIGALARYNAEVVNRTGFILNEYIKSNRLGTPEDWEADIMRVSYEDVQNVARTYLRRDNSFMLTMGTSDPGEL